MTAWHSLYLPFAEPEALAQQLKSTLTAEDYTLYDPFGLMPGRAYTQTVKTFIAPAQNGWIRLLTESALPETALAALSSLALTLVVSLAEGEARFAVYQSGWQVDVVSALTPYLTTSPETLRRALTLTVIDQQDRETTLPFDALGGEVKAMAENVNPQQAQKMFNKIAGQLLKGDQKAAARGLLNSAVDWNSAGGKRIEAVMACLTVPSWREPDYVALRDAYALRSRLRRKPNAALYPGDEAALAAVPNALDYLPVFAGKK
jgi:hypothetical protein